VGNSVSFDSATIMQKMIWFSCVHTQRLLNGFLSRICNTSLKIKRSEIDSRPPKIVVKPYKYPFKIKIRGSKKKGKEKRKKIGKKREISIRNIKIEVQKSKQKFSSIL
jgi:hypothetical protein